MGFSKASVSRAVGLLKNEGLITIEEDGQILLTEAGIEKASSVYSRHNVLTSFFADYLGVDPEIAEEDACKVEHVISEETFQKLKDFMKVNN
jgi:Mn-dependent DtxR family transcriptional regulator